MKSRLPLTALGLLALTLAGCWRDVPRVDTQRFEVAPPPSVWRPPRVEDALLAEDLRWLTIDELFRLVYQGPSCGGPKASRREPVGGICAPLAVVKAAIATFGVTRVCSNLTLRADGYHVHQRDGTRLVVTRRELALASDPATGLVPGACATQGSTSARAEVLRRWLVLYLAIAAKKLQRAAPDVPESCRDGEEGFLRAMSALRNGFSTREAPVLLGVQGYVEKVDVGSEWPEAAIVWSSAHAMFTYGDIYDRWGRPKRRRLPVFSWSRADFHPAPVAHPLADRLTGGWDPRLRPGAPRACSVIAGP